MEQLQFRVLGMTCVMCVQAIEKILSAMPQVNSADVNLNSGKVIIQGDISQIDSLTLADKIRSVGYEPEIDSFEVQIKELPDLDRKQLIKEFARIPGFIRIEENTGLLKVTLLAESFTQDDFIGLLEKKGIRVLTEPASQQDKVSSKPRSYLREIVLGSITGLFLMGLMYFKVDLLIDRRFLSFILGAPVFLYISRDIFQAAFRSLRYQVLNMDVMYAMGMGIAFSASLLSTFNMISADFVLYDTSVLLATFLLLGRHLEKRASAKTSAAIEKLIRLQPRSASSIDKESVPEIKFFISKNRGLSLALLEEFRNSFSEWSSGIQVVDEGAENPMIQIGDMNHPIRNIDELDSQKNAIAASYWDNCASIEIPLRRLSRANWLRVLPGQQIPVDGKVLWGTSFVDESMITGEPIHASKLRGSTVYGGTVNQDGVLIISVTAAGKNSILGQIIRLVEAAQGKKVPTQQLADRIVSLFIPVILLVAAIVFLGWLFWAGATFDFALSILISVLVIACPCALGLATPTALTVGLGRGAELGIFFKGGDGFERLACIKSILFDKTGTITEGKPTVTRIIPIDSNESEVLGLAASVEQYALHPLAKTLVKYAHEKEADIWPVTDFKQVDGSGVQGKLFKEEIKVGKVQWISANLEDPLTEEYTQLIESEEEKGNTVFIISRGVKVLGIIVLADEIKSGVAGVLNMFRKRDISISMLTGDSERTARAVAASIGVQNVYSSLMPGEKSDIIKKEKEAGISVCFVGDGTNDAPSLAVADVGIAMSSGTDIAIEAGDVVLMREAFSLVLNAFLLAKRVMKQIKLNLFWAFFYNLLLIPVAAGLFYPFTGILIKPEYAGLAMALSSVSVVTFSLMMKKYTPDSKK